MRTVAGIIAFLVILPSARPASDNSTAAVSMVVGNLLHEEGGPAKPTPSPLTSPFGVDFNSRGDMYVVELGGARVHRLTAAGDFSTVAGNGSQSYSGDGGLALNATFNGMHNVAVSRRDDVYIADSWNHCVRRIDSESGRITTVAGTGTAGFSGDGGPADKATFDSVICITFDPACEQLYIADINNRRIRAVDMGSHVVRTVAGNGQQGIPSDGAIATDSPLVDPRAVTADADGNVYVLERGGHALRVVTPDGRIRTIAGTGEPGFRDGPALLAQFNAPKHLCLDEHGRLLIADDRNHAIRRYDPASQSVTTVLGGEWDSSGFRLKNPHGVTFEGGALYVVDMGHDRILRLDGSRID